MTMISEPFQLYLSSAHSLRIDSKEEGIEVDAIYTSYNPGLPGYATVTAQRDGVHIWDLRNIHAVASFSVPNNVTFSAPSFSLNVSEGGDKSIISYVVAQSALDVEQHHGRVVWIIRQGLSGTKATASSKTVVVVPDPPAQICGTGHSTVPLLIVSKNGSLSIANTQVNIKNRLDWPGKRKLLETFVFPRKSCSFVQDDTDSYSSVAVICRQSSTTLQARLVLLGEKIVLAGACKIPMANAGDEEAVILAVTCSPSGVLSIFDSRGIWATYQLDHLNSSLVSTPIFKNLHIQGFTFLSTRKLILRQSFSAVSLGTSIVLLAAESHQTQDISLQIWDLSYGVLLAAQSMPVPSTIHISRLSLTVADEGQVLLTVSPARHEDRQRSSIYVVPIDTPLKSTLAKALGKTDQTAEWLVPETRGPKNEDEPGRIIANVQTFLKNNNAQKAEKAFLAWVDSHSSKEAALGYEFVKKMLNVVLSPVALAKPPHTPRIVRCILENAVVSTIAVNGRLITLLLQRGDWENVMFALTIVKDISEDELMAAAKSLIDSHQRRENAMDVDTSDGYVPPLWSFLFACVSYPSSPAPMRLAIRKHLSDAQDLVKILEILGNWIHGGDQREVEGLFTSLATNTQVPHSRADFPPYPEVIAFLRALLDASFVALLQYQPSHDLLRRILSYIEPEISFIDSMEPLRGVLEPFAKAQTLFNEKKGASKETPTEWRRRRKQLEQQAGPGVGLYRLEELVV